MTELSAAIELWLDNPFARDPDELAAAAARLTSDPPQTLSQLAAAQGREAGERYLLALGHAQAQAAPDTPSEVLGQHTLPAAARQRSGVPARGEYLPLVMAAARCHRVLSRLRGSSSAMRQLRREVCG
jgi:hypothetical protein